MAEITTEALPVIKTKRYKNSTRQIFPDDYFEDVELYSVIVLGDKNAGKTSFLTFYLEEESNTPRSENDQSSSESPILDVMDEFGFIDGTYREVASFLTVDKNLRPLDTLQAVGTSRFRKKELFDTENEKDEKILAQINKIEFGGDLLKYYKHRYYKRMRNNEYDYTVMSEDHDSISEWKEKTYNTYLQEMKNQFESVKGKPVLIVYIVNLEFLRILNMESLEKKIEDIRFYLDLMKEEITAAGTQIRPIFILNKLDELLAQRGAEYYQFWEMEEIAANIALVISKKTNSDLQYLLRHLKKINNYPNYDVLRTEPVESLEHFKDKNPELFNAIAETLRESFMVLIGSVFPNLLKETDYKNNVLISNLFWKSFQSEGDSLSGDIITITRRKKNRDGFLKLFRAVKNNLEGKAYKSEEPLFIGWKYKIAYFIFKDYLASNPDVEISTKDATDLYEREMKNNNKYLVKSQARYSPLSISSSTVTRALKLGIRDNFFLKYRDDNSNQFLYCIRKVKSHICMNLDFPFFKKKISVEIPNPNRTFEDLLKIVFVEKAARLKSFTNSPDDITLIQDLLDQRRIAVIREEDNTSLNIRKELYCLRKLKTGESFHLVVAAS